MEFSRKKKENVFLRKLKTRASGKTKKQKKKTALVCFVAFLCDHYLYAGLEKLDFHTSGKLNLVSVINGFERDREVLQRTT